MEQDERKSRHLSFWEAEHQMPSLIPEVGAEQVSPAVPVFWEWLQGQGIGSHPKGLEVCCGKARNMIWLAQQGARMSGFDFSPTAVFEGNKRAEKALGGGILDLR